LPGSRTFGIRADCNFGRSCKDAGPEAGVGSKQKATEDRRRQKTAERQEIDGRRPQNGRPQNGCPGPFLGSGHYFNFGRSCKDAGPEAGDGHRRWTNQEDGHTDGDRRWGPQMGTTSSRRACGECTCASVMHMCECRCMLNDQSVQMHVTMFREGRRRKKNREGE